LVFFSSKVLGDERKGRDRKRDDWKKIPSLSITGKNNISDPDIQQGVDTVIVTTIPTKASPTFEMPISTTVVPSKILVSSPNLEHKSLEFVPVSQRSEVITSAGVVPEVTQTVVQTIKRKIQQIGKGEILKQPVKVTPIPTEATKSKKYDFGVIKSDVLMFYNVVGGTVQVGMEEIDGKVLRTNEGEMRRIEVAINTNLKNEGVELGVTADNRFVVSKNGVSAIVEYPISVSLETRKLSVRTPYGVRQMVLSPDQALGDMLEVKAFEGFGSKVLDTTEILEGLAYEMEGEKEYKIFGYFPVKVKERVYILMDTGEIVRNNQSLWTSVVRLVSIW